MMCHCSQIKFPLRNAVADFTYVAVENYIVKNHERFLFTIRNNFTLSDEKET